MDGSTFNKVQHQFWVTKQTVYRKLGKKEDEWIVASDAILDAKLELFKSIQLTSSAVNKLLDRYQEKICSLAQEQNAMGRFLKEYGKSDKSDAGPMMIQMGKSLISCSQQEIGLRPPLLRLYQEVETFRNRAVEDTMETVFNMEANRTQYRASLNWMKNVSQELDPDTSKHLEKFRKVQSHVKNSKTQFDKLKLACLQKVDLLAAARCNMFSHALIQYHSAMTKNATKNENIYNILARTFEGQHFDFSVTKELLSPCKKVSKTGTQSQGNGDELLFDFGNETNEQGLESSKNIPNLDPQDSNVTEKWEDNSNQWLKNGNMQDNSCDLLAGILDEQVWINQNAAAENAEDALDVFLGRPSSDSEKASAKVNTTANSFIPFGSYPSLCQNKTGEHDVDNLLAKDLESSYENMDTAELIREISSNQPFQLQHESLLGKDKEIRSSSDLLSSVSSGAPSGLGTFLPSQLLEFGHLQDSGDLLNFSDLESNLLPQWGRKEESSSKETTSKSESREWHDIFASLDPIANPDAISKKETEVDSRYC